MKSIFRVLTGALLLVALLAVPVLPAQAASGVAAYTNFIPPPPPPLLPPPPP